MAVSTDRLEAIRLKAGTVGMVFDHHDGRYRFGWPTEAGEGYFAMKAKRTFDSITKAEAYAHGLADGWFASGRDGS